MSMDFGLYLEFINGGAAVEDVTSIPEEQHEKNIKSSKHNSLFSHLVGFSVSEYYSANGYFENHRFSLKENIYFDVPYSPPEYS